VQWLKKPGRVKILLDSNPLKPGEAFVISANYRAILSTAGQLICAVYARNKKP